MRVRRNRLTLLGKFSLLSLGVILVLGLGVATVLTARIEQRALRNAEELAGVTRDLGVAPQLRSEDLTAPLGERRLDELDEVLQSERLKRSGLVQAKLYNAAGRLVYSDERSHIGQNASGPGLEAALSGLVYSKVEHGTDHSGSGGEVLEVYVPLRLQREGTVDGALELYLTHEPVAAAI